MKAPNEPKEVTEAVFALSGTLNDKQRAAVLALYAHGDLSKFHIAAILDTSPLSPEEQARHAARVRELVAEGKIPAHVLE